MCCTESLRSVLVLIRHVFSSAKGRAQLAVMPVLRQIPTPTMRTILVVQRRIAAKVTFLFPFFYFYLCLLVYQPFMVKYTPTLHLNLVKENDSKWVKQQFIHCSISCISKGLYHAKSNFLTWV